MSESTVYLGLCNPKSPTNVGATMRAAGCFGAKAVFYTGERYSRAARFHTDTHQARLNIPLTESQNLLQNVPEGMAVVCVELVEGAQSLTDFAHPEKAFYIFGPEDGTVSQDVVDGADAVIYIPTTGCLNLAATVNVVLYDRLAKSDGQVTGNELIRQSRDVNNRVVWKKQP